MENWGLVIYREIYLLFNPNVSSVYDKHRVAHVVAHELAHQVSQQKNFSNFCLSSELIRLCVTLIKLVNIKSLNLA